MIRQACHERYYLLFSIVIALRRVITKLTIKNLRCRFQVYIVNRQEFNKIKPNYAYNESL